MQVRILLWRLKVKSPLFYYLMIWFQRDRSFLSFISSNQKAPYSNYILLGVNQHFENNSLQISICKVNKDIYGSHQPVPNQNVNGSGNYSQVLQDGEFCFGFVRRNRPVWAQGYSALQTVCVSFLLFINVKIVRQSGWHETLNLPLGRKASSCWVFEP